MSPPPFSTMIRCHLGPLGLVSALALLSPSALAATQRHVEHHSPDAVWFISLPDLPGLSEAYPRTSLGRLFQDEGIQQLIGGIMETEAKSPLDLALGFYEEAVLAGDLPPFLPLLKKTKALSASLVFDGAGLIEGMAAAFESGFGTGGTLAAPLFQLQAEFEDAATAAQAFNLAVGAATHEGMALAIEERGGARIAVGSMGLGVQASLVHHGAQLAMLIGRPASDDLLRRLQGTAPGLNPERLGAGGYPLVAEGTVVFDWLSRTGFPADDPLAATAEFSMAELAASLGEALFGANLSMILRGGHWRTVIDSDGAFVTEGAFDVANRPASRLLSSEPMEGNALGLLPPDAMVQWCASLSKPALGEFIESVLGTGEDGLDLGFDYKADLLGPLGNSMALGLPKPKSLLAAPPIIGVIALADAERFRRGMDSLAAWGATAAGGILLIEVSEYKNRPIYTLQLNVAEAESQSVALSGPLEGMESFVRPCLAILDDRVILTTLPNHTKRELRRALKEKGEGAVSIELEGVPKGVAQIGQADWASFLGSVYGGLKALLSMGAAGADLPVDVNALPDSDHVVSFFEPSLSWVRVHEGRGRAYQRSSFGPEFMLASVLVPVLLFVGSPAEVSEVALDARLESAARPHEGADDDGLPQAR